MAVVYLAGGLFNAGERLHNLFLERNLKALGHEIILPQREALKFFKNGNLDLNKIREDCEAHSINLESICVMNADGADPDSGACVEYGMAIATTGRAVVYRTDIRTAPEKEVGLNAMLQCKNTSYVYYMCSVTELNEIGKYYNELALKIHYAILGLVGTI